MRVPSPLPLSDAMQEGRQPKRDKAADPQGAVDVEHYCPRLLARMMPAFKGALVE